MLHTPLSFLPGMPLPHAKALATQNVHTYGDLLHYYPIRYEKFANPIPIQQLQPVPYPIQVQGTFHSFRIFKKDKRLTARFSDSTGTLTVVWFQGWSWVQNHLATSTTWVLHGKLTQFQKTLQLAHPECYTPKAYQAIPKGLQARYSITESFKKQNLTNKKLVQYQQCLWQQLPVHLPTDPLPNAMKQKYQLIPLRQAYQQVHTPNDMTQLQQAYRRLKFDELLLLQLRIRTLRQSQKKNTQGHVLYDTELFNRFYKDHLPFSLTNAQKRVIKEIHQDLSSGQQMNRLLQGDVGSGKTIIALSAILLTIGAGGTAALMAPTTLLATQHYQKLCQLLQPLGLTPSLLTGHTRSKARRQIQQKLQQRQIPLLIGTHALLEETAQFQELSLAIIDEQHRFGVAQRAKLWKGYPNPKPHVLVMTATPIPRTLAMTHYGHLDVSVLDEMPPHRKPVKTYHYFESKRLRILHFIRSQIAKGHQVYIVYPLIDTPQQGDHMNLMEGYTSICKTFPNVPISIMHGKMTPEAKAYEMETFAKGKTRIMVATTVIEVGIDVPNANTIIIEEANRFGLAQLHQLRGRVGRSAQQSYCLLVTPRELTTEAKQRLHIMLHSTDGFAIAEADLKLRGAGNVMGIQQSGKLPLRLANLTKDKTLWTIASQATADLLTTDAGLTQPRHALLKQKVKAVSWTWAQVS